MPHTDRCPRKWADGRRTLNHYPSRALHLYTSGRSIKLATSRSLAIGKPTCKLDAQYSVRSKDPELNATWAVGTGIPEVCLIGGKQKHPADICQEFAASCIWLVGYLTEPSSCNLNAPFVCTDLKCPTASVMYLTIMPRVRQYALDARQRY